MSTNADKKKVFETIGLLRTMASLPLPQNNLFSFNTFKKTESKNAFLFLIELLVSLVGIEAIKVLINTTIANKLKKFDGDFKGTMKSQLIPITGQTTQISSTLSNSFTMEMKDFDSNGMFKTDPDSSEGKLIYGNNDFQKFVYKSVLSNPNTAVAYPKNTDLELTYLKSTNQMKVRVNSSKSYETFISNLIDSIIFIESTAIIGLVIDSIFGIISKQINKSSDEILADQKLQTIFNKIENGDATTTIDSYFTFSNLENEEIYYNANYLANGNNAISVGCGVFATEINTTDISVEVNKLNNSIATPSLVNDAINNIANSYIKDPNNNIDQKDVSSIQNQFFKVFLMSLKTVLVKNTIMSPQVKVLLAINEVVNNGGVTQAFTTQEQQIKLRINLISCLIKGILKSINQTIYDLVKVELLKLVAVVASLYAQEGIDKLRNIIKSLTM